MDTYRGYIVIEDENGFSWIGDDHRRRGPFTTDEQAFDDIDRYRKALRAAKVED